MRYLSIYRALRHVEREIRTDGYDTIVHRLEIGHKDVDGTIYSVIRDVRVDVEYMDDEGDCINYRLWFGIAFREKGLNDDAYQYFRDWIDTLGLSDRVTLTTDNPENAENGIMERIIISGSGLGYQDVAQVLSLYVDAICHHPNEEDVSVIVKTFNSEYQEFEDGINHFTGQTFEEDCGWEYLINREEFKGEKWVTEPLTVGDPTFAIVPDNIKPSDALLNALTTAVSLARENDLGSAACIPVSAYLPDIKHSGIFLNVDEASILMDFDLSGEELEILKQWHNYQDLSITRSGDDYTLCTMFMLDECELDFIARFLTDYILHFDTGKKYTTEDIMATLDFDFNSEDGHEHEIEFAVGKEYPSEETIKAGLSYYIKSSE